MESSIAKAARLAGNQSALAKVLKVSPQAVQQWVAAGIAPTKRCRAIEEALRGEVTRAELRPDVFGSSEVSG